MNNNRLFGYYRDNLIAEVVDKFKCLDSNQIQILFMDNCNQSSAERKSKAIMKRIVEKKHLLKRWRMDLDEPYKYFTEDFAQKEHIVLLNWMLIHYLITHPYEQIYHMDYQRDFFNIKRPDLFLITYNSFKKEYKSTMFEMDRTITNKFDAVEKINLLYEHNPDEHFPNIIIATTNENRLIEINNQINNPNINRNKLEFKTHLIWNIKERCMNEKIKNFGNKFISCTNPVSISLR